MLVRHKKATPVLTVLLAFFCVFSIQDHLFSRNAYSSDIEGREALRKGRQLVEAGQHEAAVYHLTIAQKEFSLLGDYALLYLTEAFHGSGMHDKALITARALIQQYPASPLVRKARQNEIREMIEFEKNTLAQVFEGYAREYPDDDETAFLYASFLKSEGDSAKAKALLKQIFRKGGSRSQQARVELGPAEISVDDLMERSSNLMKKYTFDEAEDDLRKALAMDTGRNRRDIQKNLAYALFKQKKYREAASLYEKIHDTYFRARSLYRSGDYEGFNAALSELIANDDKRAGSLLLTVAADRRRQRDFENALGIYADIVTKYPSDAEEALWGTGWTLYLSGAPGKAAEVFAKLSARYDEPKYRYWQARSLEAEGKDPSQLYQSLAKIENDYYGLLSALRNRRPIKPVSYAVEPQMAATRPSVFDRVEALQALSMQKEAASEIIHALKRISTASELLPIMEKLHELGEYRREIGLAVKHPYSDKMHRFWYPLGFQDVIEPVSKKFGFDPFITLSVIREESRFDPDAVSPAGARGLMQLMPQTAYSLDKKLKLGVRRNSQIHDVNNNIMLGTFYLKSLFSEFNSLPHVIAAYNAGEAAVRKWQQNGLHRSKDEFIEEIPYAETRNYVKKVLTSYFQYRKLSAASQEDEPIDLFSWKR